VRTLARLCVTPVKGMALGHPERLTLTSEGIPENRRFFLVDGAGELFSGSDLGQLVQIRADYDPTTERLSMRFPDDGEVIGHAGTLGEAMTVDFYGRPVPAHVVGGPWAEAVSAFAGRDLRLLRCDRDGDGADVHRLTLVSYASVQDLATRGRHEGDLDARRFRINLELEGCSPYEEDGWAGARVHVGEAVIRVKGQIPRCLVTQQAPMTGDRDWNTLTQIAKYRARIAGDGGLPFGMYAEVERPGTIALGDPIEPSAERVTRSG
jgi:uncharacterized protein YcbX